MNMRIVLLLIIGVSFLFFGCAKQAGEPAAPAEESEEEVEVPEEEVPAEEEPGEVPPVEEEPEEEIPENVSEEEQELADLFQIDTDEPLGDEGLGMETPSSNSS